MTSREQRFGDPSERRVLVQAAATASGARVSPDGRWLAYALTLPAGPEVFVQPTPQKLFDIHTQWFAPNQPHNVEVADNGQKFLVNTIVGNSDNAPLYVIVNWLKALGK